MKYDLVITGTSLKSNETQIIKKVKKLNIPVIFMDHWVNYKKGS